ncbi:MAG: flagellar biosynthesis protein FlhF [Ignavibacteriaceae bacterium]|jgi:flagellar biosynthesis protein FlhF
MQIKKYIASTLKEATATMKLELGGEAIILSTRIIEADSKSDRKKMFELTAGVENLAVNQKSSSSLPLPLKGRESQKKLSDELKSISEKIYHKPEAPAKRVASQQPLPQKSKLKEGADSILGNELKEIVDTLVYREVQKPIITSILGQLEKQKSFLHPSNIDSYVLQSIASMIPVKNFELRKKGKPTVISLVGPTGVGKTTCIAKLAVISKILHKLDVGLISSDTYRLGAIDQLKIFSEISNIDLLVAYEPSEMPKLIESFKKKDVIFIDTAGRSQKSLDQLNKTKEFLDAVKVDETYLVLSTTGNSKNLYDVAEKFKLFDYNALIFTKLDEAAVFGNILNVSTNFNTPIIFLSNGQVIPDDIIAADQEFIAKIVYTGKMHK